MTLLYGRDFEKEPAEHQFTILQNCRKHGGTLNQQGYRVGGSITFLNGRVTFYVTLSRRKHFLV